MYKNPENYKVPQGIFKCDKFSLEIGPVIVPVKKGGVLTQEEIMAVFSDKIGVSEGNANMTMLTADGGAKTEFEYAFDCPFVTFKSIQGERQELPFVHYNDTLYFLDLNKKITLILTR